MAQNIRTKNILLGVIILIGILTMAGLVCLIIVFMEDRAFLDSIKIESILGSFTLGGMGALTYFTKRFIDSRSNREKDEAKRARKQDKFAYKLEKYKIKIGAKHDM